jgi:hypothetical protein
MKEIPVTTMKATSLPKFDVSRATATSCIISLIFTGLVVLSCGYTLIPTYACSLVLGEVLPTAGIRMFFVSPA